MSTAALQMPVRHEAGERVGRRRFRKQILPVGSITYEGETLTFTRDGSSDPERGLISLADLHRNFYADALDQVPFVLADAANRHSDAPDRFCGDVDDLELTDDGLYAVIAATRKGAKLIGDNPKLGVSARIHRQRQDWGPRALPALGHVCATLNPHIGGMADWEFAGSDLSAAYLQGEVIDLTTATYRSENDNGMDAIDFTSPRMDPQSVADCRTMIERLRGTKPELARTMQSLLALRVGDPLPTTNLSAEAQAAIDLAVRMSAAASERSGALLRSMGLDRADGDAAAHDAAARWHRQAEGLPEPTTAKRAADLSAGTGKTTAGGAVVLRELDNGRQLVWGTEEEVYPPDDDAATGEAIVTGREGELSARIDAATSDEERRSAMLELLEHRHPMKGMGTFAAP